MLINFYRKHRTVIQKTLFVVALIAFVFLFINTIFTYVAPFVVAYIFSLIAEPLVSVAEKRLKIRRWLSAIISIALILALAVFIGTNVVSRLADQAENLRIRYPAIAEDVRETIEDLVNKYVPEDMWDDFDNIMDSAFSSGTQIFSEQAKDVGFGFVQNIPIFVANTLLTIISSFFFIKDRQLIRDTLNKHSPRWLKGNFETVRKGLSSAIIGYIKAQAIIMSVTSSIAILSLTIYGSDYALLVGLLIGLVDALPVFGSGFILWPWIAFNLISGQYVGAVTLAVCYVCIFLTRQLLEPKVLSSQIGLHPLLTLSSMYAGFRLFGFAGFIAGPMIVVTAKIIFETPTREEEPAPVTTVG